MRTFFSWFSMIVFVLAALFGMMALGDLSVAGRPGGTELGAAIGIMLAAGMLRVLCEICAAVELPAYKLLSEMRKNESPSATSAAASASAPR